MEPKVNNLSDKLQLLWLNDKLGQPVQRESVVSNDGCHGGESNEDDDECDYVVMKPEEVPTLRYEETQKKKKTRRAGVVLIWRDEVAIVKQRIRDTMSNSYDSRSGRRIPKYKQQYYNFPKGHAHENEDIRAAAVRELYEETGIAVSPGDLGMEFILTCKKLRENCHFFITFLYPDCAKPLLNIASAGGELEKAEWIKFDEFRKFTDVSKPTKATIKYLEGVVVLINRNHLDVEVPLFRCWEPETEDANDTNSKPDSSN
jgi:8-oxo-dGTP pyrophosphatase MutT (NUDIX family)